MTIGDLYNILRENQYKITYQRKQILQLLINNKDTFLSCEEMEAILKRDVKDINLSTIYRNLDILEKLHLLHRYTANSGHALFKLSNITHHHHHLTCIKCKKTTSFDFCPIDEFQKIAEENEYLLKDHAIELLGICKDCQ